MSSTVIEPPTHPTHQPYVRADTSMRELTAPAVLAGTFLGILFGASSLYLVLKVGMTVSASIPVAVLSITLFRALAKIFGVRQATILENNIVQTTGSAGESIAFGIGVTIPALLLLGFDMEPIRAMTVGMLGGLLGILMMIPLRRAFIVRRHGELTYPEGTACADVLVVGEQGGATALTVFLGFGVAFIHKFLVKAGHLFKEEVAQPLVWASGRGLKGGEIAAELSPELLGVGFIIGPKIASTMAAGGVLAYLVIAPIIVLVGGALTTPLAPSTTTLIKDMSVGQLRNNYILYIGAGAVATGGIISMVQALPLIVSSLASSMKDLGQRSNSRSEGLPRTERDLPLWLVGAGMLGMIVLLAAIPSLGLGLNLQGLLGAGLIVFFGFLFVTVSSRLTGEIGSSSNPISGMTVATLLLTCLLFLSLERTGKAATLTALTVAAVVCVASSNAGTTAQDLKTGFLVGATPSSQQIAILIGALTSAAVIGLTLLLLNDAGTIYTKRAEYLPNIKYAHPSELTKSEQVPARAGHDDPATYRVLHVGEGELEGVPQGKYLIDDQGTFRYLVDPAINGRVRTKAADGSVARARDDGTVVANSFEAPKTRLMALIIDGVLKQTLPWEMVLIGALIAVTLEMAGVPSLPFAVGVYLPIAISMPIFVGGLVRGLLDRWSRLSRRHDGNAEMGAGVLLSSGYIAGGSLAGVTVAFLEFAPAKAREALDVSGWFPSSVSTGNKAALIAFGVLVVLLALVGSEWLTGTRPKTAALQERENNA